jgi:hypothetical protein
MVIRFPSWRSQGFPRRDATFAEHNATTSSGKPARDALEKN